MLREIVEAVEQDYEAWLKASAEVRKTVDDISDKMDVMIKKSPGSMGGASEELRVNKDFRALKKQFDSAFKYLQNFNKTSPKAFLKREFKEKRASWRK